MYVLDTGPYFKPSFQENETLARALEFEPTILSIAWNDSIVTLFVEMVRLVQTKSKLRC